MTRLSRPGSIPFLASICCLSLQAVPVITLNPSPASPQPVGTAIVWTAAATDTDAGAFNYRYSVRAPGKTNFDIVVDLGISPTFRWIPSQHEGTFEIRVSVKNTTTKVIARFTRTFTLTSRIISGVPVVSPTIHPLVALYSVPPCAAGATAQVWFKVPGDEFWKLTPTKDCTPGLSVNFYIAGMYADTTYLMHHEIVSGNTITKGSPLSFRTGVITIDSLTINDVNPADAPGSLIDGVVLHNFNTQAGARRLQTATDLTGRVIWYDADEDSRINRPGPNGTFLVIARGRIFRQVDLVGGVIRETSLARINELLRAQGKQQITSLHHDVQLLPNGHVLFLGSNERLLTDVQGAGTVDVIGDSLAVLDQNLQLVWEWNAFDHLDVTRKAILDEKCPFFGAPGCPPFFLAPSANDWLHANSVALTPDGGIIMSLRHQDWVIKIDYRNGTGTGAVLWRLGQDGDFAIDSTDPHPWFSHQHDAEFDDSDPTHMSLYDNGNLRRESSPTANSRGQVYALDEVNRRARHILNADFGHYSFAVGSAQRTTTGDYHFLSGLIEPTKSQSVEIRPSGNATFRLESQHGAYRSFRMQSMYDASGLYSGPYYRK